MKSLIEFLKGGAYVLAWFLVVYYGINILVGSIS